MSDTPFFRTGLDVKIIGPLARDPARLRTALERFRKLVVGPTLHPDINPDDDKTFADISGAVDELTNLSDKELSQQAMAYVEFVKEKGNDPMLRKVIRDEFEAEITNLQRDIEIGQKAHQSTMTALSAEKRRSDNFRTVFSDALQQVIVRIKSSRADSLFSLYNFRNRHFCAVEEKKGKEDKVWKLILKLYLVGNDGWVYENRLTVLDRQGASWTSVESDEAIKMAKRQALAAIVKLQSGTTEGWSCIGLLIGFLEKHPPAPRRSSDFGSLIQREQLTAEFTPKTESLAVIALDRQSLMMTRGEVLTVIYVKFEPADPALTNFTLKKP
ncbi:MAG: hypothetical protein WD157_01215 [Patescibacteria group bacterium]